MQSAKATTGRGQDQRQRAWWLRRQDDAGMTKGCSGRNPRIGPCPFYYPENLAGILRRIPATLRWGMGSRWHTGVEPAANSSRKGLGRGERSCLLTFICQKDQGKQGFKKTCKTIKSWLLFCTAPTSRKDDEGWLRNVAATALHWVGSCPARVARRRVGKGRLRGDARTSFLTGIVQTPRAR